MLNLPAPLAQAQRAQSRNPLVSIRSERWMPSIPFEGRLLDGETPTTRPNAITHSSGRLYITAIYSNRHIRLTYTNLDRTEFFYQSFNIDAPLIGADLCELAGGNIGLVYIRTSGGSHHLHYKILNETGVLQTEGVIADWPATIATSEPFVARLADDSYYLVYAKTIEDAHSFYRRTSSDFETWSSEEAITLPEQGEGRLRNPYLHVEPGGGLRLLFDHADTTAESGELRNIYRSVSTDNGATWSAVVKETNYSSLGTIGGHPALLEREGGTGFLAYTETRNVLTMPHTSEGAYCLIGFAGGAVSVVFDPVNRMLYAVYMDTYIAGSFKGTLKINVDTWEIENCWSTTSIPGYNSRFSGSRNLVSHIGYGNMIAARAGGTIAILDGEENTIRHINFSDHSSTGLSKNIEWDRQHSGESLSQVTLDVDNKILWCTLTRDYFWQSTVNVVKVDIMDPVTGPWTGNKIWGINLGSGISAEVPTKNFYPFISEDIGVLCLHERAGFRNDIYAFLISLSSGTEWKRLRRSENNSLPGRAFRGRPLFKNGTLYTGFPYSGVSGESEKRGLCIVDVNSGNVTYERPTYATLDDYHISDIKELDENTLIMRCSHGYCTFCLQTHTWRLYGPTTVNGMPPTSGVFVSNASNYREYTIDPDSDIIYAGHSSGRQASNAGAFAFSLDGSFSQVRYLPAEKNGEWSFGDSELLVRGVTDLDFVGAIDPDDQGLYGFWTNEAGSDRYIKWEKEDPGVDLSPYLLRNTVIERMETVDNTPGRVTFAVSHGHLFDPYNLASLLSPVLKKERKIILRFGERVNGTEYWADQGIYLVTEQHARLERGEYPGMNIVAEDRRVLWQHQHIRATPHWNHWPEDIIRETLHTFGSMAYEDIRTFSFDGDIPRVQLTHQWSDMSLQNILDQIYERFGCFLKIDVQGRITYGTISENKPPNLFFFDRSRIISFSPDDRYSDFTNRVTIEAIEQGKIKVLHAEEQIDTLYGTVGWWGYRNDYKVWYSKDKSRVCYYPRLEVVETATSIMFRLAGKIREEIRDNDPDKRYCTVRVSAPNLIPVLVAGIATYIAGAKIGDWAPMFGGMTIPVGRYIESTGLIIVLMVLASTGNYQYQIHAQPEGEVERSIQATANDHAHQQEIGTVVERVAFDPLCSTIAHCQQVADHELSVLRMQRKRAAVELLTDLRIEQGDCIQFPHLYTQRPTNFFITNLRRRMKMPEGPEDDGYFTDTLEGWVLS